MMRILTYHLTPQKESGINSPGEYKLSGFFSKMEDLLERVH